MPRATNGTNHHKRRSKILKATKGFIGGRKILYHTAKDARRRALTHSYQDRRTRSNDFRRLWITRINAASRECGISYSKFIDALSKANIQINRKMLAELAVNDFNSFKQIVEEAKKKVA